MLSFFVLLYKYYLKNTALPDTIYLAFSFSFIGIIVVSLCIRNLWDKYGNAKVINWFLLPGAIVKGFSYSLSCLITGTTIKQLSIYGESREIVYDKPNVRGVFDFIIALSPLFGCGFAIVLISVFIESPIKIKETLPNEIAFSADSMMEYMKNYIDTVWLSFNSFRETGFSTLRSAVCILFSIIFTVSMAPRRQEIKFLVPGLIILGTILFAQEIYGIALLDYKWWHHALIFSWMITTYIISILLTVLVFSVIIVLIIRGFYLVFGRGRVGKGMRNY